MVDARVQLDRQYYEMRWRVLSLAADLDRVERLPGGEALLASDARLVALRQCIAELLADAPGRAERVQSILSER